MRGSCVEYAGKVCGRIRGRSMEGLWKVCGRSAEGLWKVCGRFMEGMWKVCGGYGLSEGTNDFVRSAWNMRGRSVNDLRKIRPEERADTFDRRRVEVVYRYVDTGNMRGTCIEDLWKRCGRSIEDNGRIGGRVVERTDGRSGLKGWGRPMDYR